jgi:AcrR family transcriptional regulator
MHTRETILRAREMYRDGVRVREICAATGMSTGTLYYHLDGLSLPGPMPPRLPRRRQVEGNALQPMPWRGRKKLAARLWRAADRQARKLEYFLTWDYQRQEDREKDLAALREMTRILRELAAFEDACFRTARAERGSVEREEALAVEGRALFVRRTRRGM